MSKDEFSTFHPDTNTPMIVSPTGKNLRLVGTKTTTLFDNTSEKVVRVTDKYVLPRITTETTGFTLQKLYGHPNVATDFRKSTQPQPAIVVPTYRANLLLFDAAKGESGSTRYDINVTRDAWYYLGIDSSGTAQCRNIAFEPADQKENKYLTEQIHFPSRADDIMHGYFLMESESQRGQVHRFLRAEPVSNANPYGPPLSVRQSESLASNVMFHVGGFYMARLGAAHARWLGGSEGCFAFIPQESVYSTPETAAKVTLETAFFSNRTWVTLTSMIERFRDSGPKKSFIVEVERRQKYNRDERKEILLMSGPLDKLILPMQNINAL